MWDQLRHIAAGSGSALTWSPKEENMLARRHLHNVDCTAGLPDVHPIMHLRGRPCLLKHHRHTQQPMSWRQITSVYDVNTDRSTLDDSNEVELIRKAVEASRGVSWR